jgi:alpha-1,2-mannosyltransferase
MPRSRPEPPAPVRDAAQSRLGAWPFVIFLIFAVVNAGNALHKGGDLEIFLEGGRRWLAGSPLYAGSGPGTGFIGPPFQALFFAPFSRLAADHEAAARLLWHLVNVVALAAGTRWWFVASREDARRSIWRAPAVLFALAAIALPAQTNFEHQNMNPLLLALTGAAALLLVRGRDGWAGIVIGGATALKAFPALLVVYLAISRSWRATTAALLSAGLLTAAGALRYGARSLQVFGDWIAINREGWWPDRPQNQSIHAAVARLGWGDPAVVTSAASLTLVVLLGVLTWRRLRPIGHDDAIADKLALWLGAAVLISPIAWDHYWVLMLPLLLTIRPRQGWRLAVLVAAALLMTGISPVLVGTSWFNLARQWSAETVAGFLLVLSGGAGLAATLTNPARTK